MDINIKLRKIISKILYVFVLIFLTVLLSIPASALSEDLLDMYAQNNILFYNPEDDPCETQTTTRRSDGSDVNIIGDSITALSQNEILEKLPNANIDALSGTWFSEYNQEFGASGLERLSTIGHRDVLVFAMGSNGGVTSEDIDKLVQEAGNDTEIILMTIYYRGLEDGYVKTTNEVIKQSPYRYSNITILDWYSAVKNENEKYIASDNVHPTDEGKVLFADLIQESVNSVTRMEISSVTLSSPDDGSAYSRLKAAVKDYGETAMAMQIEWGTPWEVVMAQMQIESGVGTAGHAVEGATNNWLGITGSGDAGYYVSSGGRHWAKYSSVEKSIEAWAGTSVLRNGYYDDAFPYLSIDNWDLRSFLVKMISHYAPSSDGNNEEAYVNNILSLIDGPIKEAREAMGWPSSEELARQYNIQVGGKHPIGSEVEGETNTVSSYSSNLFCQTANEFGGNLLAQLAVNMSWPDRDHYREIKPEYQLAMKSVLGAEPTGNYCGAYGGTNSGALDYYQDCGHFVATVVRYSGLDDDFPLGGTSNMESYMANSDIWMEIDNLGNTSNLMPGDIFVVNLVGGQNGGDGHIMMYVGDYGGDYNLASASLCSRTANLGNVYFSDSRGSYRIFRYAGTGGVLGSFAQEINDLEASTGYKIGAYVTAPGDASGDQIQYAGTWQGGRAWSTIKVPLSIAATQEGNVLSGTVTDPYGGTCNYSSIASAINQTIKTSANCAAWWLWQSIGGDGNTAATRVNNVLRSGNDTITNVVANGDGSSLTSGKTIWQLRDQVIFAANMSSINGASTTLTAMLNHAGSADDGSGLLNRSIFSQSMVKGGWGGGTITRQFGIVKLSSGKCSAIAIGLEGSDNAFSTLTSIARILKNHESELPSGACPSGL